MATKATNEGTTKPRAAESGTAKRRIRKVFGNIHEVVQMPNLIEVQRESYEQFLRSDPSIGYVSGLEKTLRSVFPIRDFAGTAELDFVNYELEPPKFDTDECRQRGITYAAPMRVTLRLIVFEVDADTDSRSVLDIKEQDVYMGDMPLMTGNGTFIINGTERVIVSQMHRSPGVLFDHDRGKTHASGKYLFAARVIPYRGSWLDFEFDAKDIVNVRIDRKRKLPVTALLYALGMTGEEILNHFYNRVTFVRGQGGWIIPFQPENWRGQKPMYDIIDAKTGEIVFANGQKISPRAANKAAKDGLTDLLIPTEEIFGRYSAYDLINDNTGQIYIEAGDEVSAENLELLDQAGIDRIELLDIDHVATGPWIRNTLKVDKAEEREQALSDIYRVMRPGEPPTLETAESLFSGLFFDPDRYDLSAVGRVKLNMRLDLDVEDTVTTLRTEDILEVVKTLVNLKDGKGDIDDIDNLGNRRVRSVGELLENQYRVGLLRMERAVKERMSSVDVSTVMPNDLINAKPAVAAVREFFGSSQLSQFMDQTNPLSEVTHKRRVSALGPGGLTRERAGFEVRDVHYTHYGRLCPIETPEGSNIGLISYLASFAKINKYGFIEAPYRRVDKETGVVTDEVVYMPADVEDEYIVAQANEPLDENNRFVRSRVSGRHRNDIQEFAREQVDFMDVSPRMMVSVATACIPFLENDDCNRALMGSNMQRQAVPLMVTQRSLVATGMEYKAATDSGVCVLAAHDGTVESVDADKVVVRLEDGSADTYELIKFMRSNQGTCVNQRPAVYVGDVVKKGDVLADGPATKDGEISLGKNALIGFMTWEGYNYEDAVLLNEKLVREDIYTSIHIEEYESEARDTKLGPEEVTRDIPNVGDDSLKDLDDRGIIRIGAEVKTGDILVGKVTPKGETELTAEERLLRAIFGEKAREVRDTSLRVPHGAYGIVVDVKVFTPENSDELQPGVRTCVRVYIAQKRKISVGDKMAGRHGNKGVVSRILPQEDMPFLPDGTPLDIVLNPLGVPSRMNIGQVLEVNLGYVAKALGWHVQTPVFDGAHESDIRDCLAEARDKWHGDHAPEYPTKLPRLMGDKGHIIDFSKIDLTDDGKTTVYDGRTGEKFPSKVTVGYMYYLKLHHLVDDKIHARSTGPYSLVTQQPLGGKAQFGGQRFGEMEVWALEAYGAAYTLQEILTVKSDDVVGRVKTYEAIVKGEDVPNPGIPESFRVMLKELQSLGLDIVVQDKEGNAVDMRQEYDDDDANFDNSDIGDNVLLESELQDDYSVKDADEGFDDDLGDEEPDEASLAQIEADNGDDLFDGE